MPLINNQAMQCWSLPRSVSNSMPQLPNTKTTLQLLKLTTNLTVVFKQCSSLPQAKSLHAQLLTQALSHLTTYLIPLYLSFNSPSLSRSILTSHISPSPFSVYSWNTLIRHSVIHNHPNRVLSLVRDMLRYGWRPDEYTFPYVFKACGDLGSLKLISGSSLHAAVFVTGFECNVFVCNGVVAMYGKCRELGYARKMFDEMCERGVYDVVSWNSIIAGYVQRGDARSAFRLFEKMRGEEFGITPDVVSLVSFFPCCASTKDLDKGREGHGYSVRNFLVDDVFVANAVVDMYAKCERMDDARKVFEGMEDKDVVSWNALVTGYSQIGRYEEALRLFERMRQEKIELNVVTWSAVIAGYAQRGLGYEALDIFRQMLASGSEPNIVTLVSLLSGCASVGALLQGKETHAYAVRCILNIDGSECGEDLMVINGIIDMYAKCKKADVARTMFDSIAPENRNVVTWTTMIGGYAQHNEANDALELFSQMLTEENPLSPNAFTISCALMACARLGALRFGREIHAYVVHNRFEHVMLFIANCLIDMYSKSGDVDAARTVFKKMSNRNAVSWTSLMTGYGMHGRGEEALSVFDEMRKEGFKIDGVTFVVVLYACSHAGMVDKGTEYFDSMREEFGVVPGVEHYACMVDLLGRGGRLEEAMKLIKGMPMEPTPIVWFSLLSACRLHASVELGEYAASRLVELESGNDGSYTLLSNIYANARRWKDVAKVRTLMKHTGIRKRPGCSWVQGKKGTASFFVGDRSHLLSKEIYELLADLILRIKRMGYIPEMRFALHDVDDEEKGDLLFEHSEKLALAYGILTTPSGSPIRITKNLRVCGDCHNAITYISSIVNHKVILRDSSRFHHFKNGSCSCNGYW